MNLVSCPKCSAQFDVSTFEPGSTFVCGACKNTLQVPAAKGKSPGVGLPPGARRVPGDPAAPSTIAKKPGMDRRRAGDAAGEAKVEGRAERIRRQRESAEGEGGKKKNPLPLVAAAIGAVALVGGGIFMMSGAKEKPKDAGAETAPAPGPAKPAVATGERTYEQMSATDRLAILEQRKKEGLRSAAALKESHAWLLSKGLQQDAKALLDAGRKAFPEDPWIGATLGLVDRGADIRKAAGDEVLTDSVPEDDPDLKFLMELQDRIRKDKQAAWIPKADSDRLDAVLAVLKEKASKASDPVYQSTKREYDNVRLNAAFSGMDFSFESFRPYVIFVERPGPDRKEEADRITQGTGKVLTFLYARWLQFMKEDLKLDPPRLEDQGDARLRVFVFKSRKSFDEWHVKNGIPSPGDSVAAYYQHGHDKMILMHLDYYDAGTIMHEATHQIIHWYARWFTQQDDDAVAKKEGKAIEKVEFDDDRLRSAFFWFQEGIAEYFGGAVKDRKNEGEWKIGALQVGRLMSYADKKAKRWAVPDFLYLDQGRIYARAKVMSGGLSGDELKEMMYCQGWGLVHYFLHGEGGRWREKFCTFMREELCGRSGKIYLLRSFGLPTKSEDPKVQAFMKEIDEGYTKYMDGLLKNPR
jgi:hypothetical protein